VVVVVAAAAVVVAVDAATAICPDSADAVVVVADVVRNRFAAKKIESNDFAAVPA